MPDRCQYCGREEGETEEGFVHILICPVCKALACPFCLSLVEFSEEAGHNEDGQELVKTWRAAVCRVHVPWNIIEGIKKKAEEEKDG